MKRQVANSMKKVVLFAVCAWGLLSVLFLSGEPASADMPEGKFALLKLAGFISLAGAIIVGRWAMRKGWMQFNPEDDMA